MKALFIHQNFPGQYKHLAPRLASLGHRVKALCVGAPRAPVPGVDVIRYPIKRGTTPNIHPWAADFETKIIRGEACARAMRNLKEQGFEPDIVLAHPGWGEPMFVKDVFPNTRLLSFIEFYYRAHGQDVNFDKEFEKRRFEDDARTRTKTANMLLALEAMDWGVSPTVWQRDTNPQAYRDRISAIHDGVDTDHLRPDPAAELVLPDGGPTLRAGDEVLTFVNRNLEPLRGFHIFMRALPAIQKARPDAQIVIVGGDSKGYGGGAGGWKERPLADSFRGQHPLSVVRADAAGVPRPCLSELSVRAVMVDDRGHELRLRGDRRGHAARARGDPRRRERPAGGFLRHRRPGGQARLGAGTAGGFRDRPPRGPPDRRRTV